jgi:hypothetical protein
MTNNDMKKTVLDNMAGMLKQLRQEMEVLDALDRDTTTSGAGDLHDQLHTMSKTMDAFDAVVTRSVAVVPSKSVASWSSRELSLRSPGWALDN